MSAVMGSYTYEMDASYAADFSRDREPLKKRSRHPEYRRKGSAPTRVNGMHCRRNKRWTWGSGRGARMSNMRAFAGCVAIAIALLSTRAFAVVTFNMATIGNGGNANNIVGGTNYGGSVLDTFLLSKTETTNAEYVEFLNAVDEDGTNTLGLWNQAQASNQLYGIERNLAAPVGSRYSSKAGKPGTAPVGTTYASSPVNNLSWWSAARFVNWIAGGQQTGTAGAATAEGGFAGSAYTLAGGTSGALVSRNAGATYWLPSADEWYKAAFYNGSSATYTLYASNNNVAPTAQNPPGGSNSGNFNQIIRAPVNVGSYFNTTSSYGLFDMLGNVVEWTDSAATGTQARVIGGGFAATSAAWNATALAINQDSTFTNSNYGFRVAQVAPVPEPETITLAAFGIVGLCGANWIKRRRKLA